MIAHKVNNYTTDTSPCPRCGEEHLGLRFTLFTKFGMVADFGSTGMFVTYWSMCPTTNEPIVSLDMLDKAPKCPE